MTQPREKETTLDDKSRETKRNETLSRVGVELLYTKSTRIELPPSSSNSYPINVEISPSGVGRELLGL